MKHCFFRFLLVALFSFALPNVNNAQTCGIGCLGTWCYVDVSLSDPTYAGDLIYVIPVPPEGFAGSIMGPGSPRLYNNLGSTVELRLKKSHLEVESDGGNAQFVLDALTNEFVQDMEGSISSGGYARCHYHIILNVTP